MVIRRKIIFLLILVGAMPLSILLPRPAFAHVPQTDGSIGAVAHIDHGDNPIVGREPAAAAAHSSTHSSLGGHWLHIILFGGSFVAVFAMHFWDRYKHRRNKSNNKTSPLARLK